MKKEHITDMPHCWCNPKKEVMPNGNMVIVHNYEMFLTHKEILGAFAYCIVRQSPFIPDVRDMLKQVKTRLSEHKDGLDVQRFDSPSELRKFVKTAVHEIKEIADLNVSLAQKQGLPTPEVMVTSRYHTPKPEYDFVDLTALTRNISNQLESQ